MRFLLFDTETGGFDPKVNSLLTAAFMAIDYNKEKKKLKVLDTISIRLKHKKYNVTEGAMKVNKIDLEKHDAKADPLHICQSKLMTFVHRNKINPAEKLMPAGHNVMFDVGFLYAQLLYPGTLHHHYFDTMILAQALKMVGKLPADLSVSLESLGQFFGIEYEAHNAVADTVTTLKVWRRELKLLEAETIQVAAPALATAK